MGSDVGGLGRCVCRPIPGHRGDRRRVRSDDVRELWRRSQSVAAGLVAGGVEPSSVVGLLGRNHRGFVEAFIAVSAIGADIVLLNTGFAGPQLADVVADEGISHVIHDVEFADVVATCDVEAFDETLLAGFASTGATVGARTDPGAGRDPDFWHHRPAEGCG